MKRTTYIFIGIYLAGIVLIISIIILMRILASSMSDNIYRQVDLVRSENRENARINSCKVITFDIRVPEIDGMWWSASPCIKISPAKKDSGDQIIYPDMEHIKIIQKGDTLNILMDFTENTPEIFAENNYILLGDILFEIESSSSLSMIQSDKNVLVEINSMKLNSLSLDVPKARVNSSTFSSINLLDKNTEFQAVDSEINTFSADLDKVKNYNFENSIIETLCMTGSGRHSDILGKAKIGRVIWKPKTDGSKLTLESDKAMEIVFKE